MNKTIYEHRLAVAFYIYYVPISTLPVHARQTMLDAIKGYFFGFKEDHHLQSALYTQNVRVLACFHPAWRLLYRNSITIFTGHRYDS